MVLNLQCFIENTGSATVSGKYRFQSKHYGDITFLGFTKFKRWRHNSSITRLSCSGNYTAAVNVPAQRFVVKGDLTMVSVRPLCHLECGYLLIIHGWIIIYLEGVNPNTSPNWVTNITGNASHDDDFVFLPVQQMPIFSQH